MARINDLFVKKDNETYEIFDKRISEAPYQHIGYAFFECHNYDSEKHIFSLYITWHDRINALLEDPLPPTGFQIHCSIQMAECLLFENAGIPVFAKLISVNGIINAKELIIRYFDRNYIVAYTGCNAIVPENVCFMNTPSVNEDRYNEVIGDNGLSKANFAGSYNFRNSGSYKNNLLGAGSYNAGSFFLGSFNAGSFTLKSFANSSFYLKYINNSSFNLGSYNNSLFSLGSFNAGSFNLGSFNLGLFNLSSFNLGSFNLGQFNISSFNLTSFNLGMFNLGSFNLGSFNWGMFNLGSFNLSSFNMGSFNVMNFFSGSFNAFLGGSFRKELFGFGSYNNLLLNTGSFNMGSFKNNNLLAGSYNANGFNHSSFAKNSIGFSDTSYRNVLSDDYLLMQLNGMPFEDLLKEIFGIGLMGYGLNLI